MAVTDLGTVGSAGLAATISLSVTVPAGALIVVVAVEAGVNGTLSDPVNGSYTVVNAGAPGYNLFYKANAQALTAQNLTYTKGGGTGNGACFAALYATGGFSLLDSAVTASNSGSPITTLSTTSGVPVMAGELFFAAVMTQNSGGSGGGSSNTGSWVTPPDPVTGLNSGGSIMAEVIMAGDQVNAAATALTFNPNAWTNAVAARSLIVAFEIPSGAVFADQQVSGRRSRGVTGTESAGAPFPPAAQTLQTPAAQELARRRALSQPATREDRTLLPRPIPIGASAAQIPTVVTRTRVISS